MLIRSIILSAIIAACLAACPQKYYTASSINLPPGAEMIKRTINPQGPDLFAPFDLSAFNVALIAQFKDRTGWSAVVTHYDSSLGNGGYAPVAAGDPLYTQIANGQETGDALRLYNVPDTGKYVLVSDIYAMLREDRSPSVSPDWGMYVMAVMEKKP